MTRQLILVGGGLAHLHVLREWRRRPPPDVELTVVSPTPVQYYSGMVPGFVHGAYEPDMLRIDLAGLARRAGARFVEASAERVLSSRRIVEAGGVEIGFDLCSLDVGSGVSGSDVPGVRAHAITLRPMARALDLRARIDDLVSRRRPFEVVIVGAGAGGVEIAFATQRRIAASDAGGSVILTDTAGTLLASEPEALRSRVLALLHERGIGLVLGSAVKTVGPGGLTLSSGASVAADLVIWTTGTAPPPLLAQSDLPVSDAGYVLVDRFLHVVKHTHILAAGDCIAFDEGRSPPRSGAYAVRQGPILLHNLRAALGVQNVRPYRPRRRALVLLDTANGRAIARWGGMTGYGSWAWWLKQRIDRRFVDGFRAHVTKSPPLPVHERDD